MLNGRYITPQQGSQSHLQASRKVQWTLATGVWFFVFCFFSNSYVMDGTSLMNAKKYCKMKTC